MNPRIRSILKTSLLAGCFLLYTTVLLNTAWLSEDAFISLRSAGNFLAGDGPVWNPKERVQVYSHPLWFMIVTLLGVVWPDLEATVMGLSLAISLAVVLLLCVRPGSSVWRRAFVVILASSSASFVDFSTSGLENPLTHLIAALFFFAYVRKARKPEARLFVLSLLAALGITNRHDTALFYLLPLVGEFITQARAGFMVAESRVNAAEKDHFPAAAAVRGLFRPAAFLTLGMTPFFAWTVFSLIYYGFPFPNTAYAKLSTGIPKPELIEQGLAYLMEAGRFDPATPGVIAIGIVVGLSARASRYRIVAGSIILLLLYTVRIGGDFMSGRFFSLPFVIALLLIAEAPLERISAGWIGAGIAALILLIPIGILAAPDRAPLLSPFNKKEIMGADDSEGWWRGIAHERNYYYPWTGLLRENPRNISKRNHLWSRRARSHVRERPSLIVTDAVGFKGQEIGDRAHILDPLGLADPLLARLPCIRKPRCRIGHFRRRVPEGYVSSLLFDENRLTDPDLAAYFDDLRLVTRGPVFSHERLWAIWRLNTNGGPHVTDPDRFAYPGEDYLQPARRHYKAVNFSRADGVPRTCKGWISFAVHWREPPAARALEITPALQAECGLRIARRGVKSRMFMLEGRRNGALARRAGDESGLYPVPGIFATRGFDSLTFVPADLNRLYRFKSIRPLSAANQPVLEPGADRRLRSE